MAQTTSWIAVAMELDLTLSKVGGLNEGKANLEANSTLVVNTTLVV
jgi:hypothetical protein